MLTAELDEGRTLVTLTISGPIGKKGYDTAAATIDRAIALDGSIRVLEIVRTLDLREPEHWWRDLSARLTKGSHLRRVAVVSKSGSVGPLAYLCAPLHPARIAYFTEAELEAAEQWLMEDENPARDHNEAGPDFA